MKYVTTIDGREFVIEILDDATVQVNGKTYTIDFDSICDQPVYSLLLDGRSYEGYVYPGEEDWQVLLHGRFYPARVEDELARLLRQATSGEMGEQAEFQLRAPMPGLVVSVAVAEGQAVSKGQVLAILESMKMQNELKSPRDGTVGRVRVQPGDSVEQRQVMLSVV
ncbi:MAG: biotin/lipoyl-containing protein [Chloroflexota bacterium]